MPSPIGIAFAVDALSPQLTGIGRYCLELGRGLRRAPEIGRISYFHGQHWLDNPEALLEEGWQVPGGRWRRRFANWRGRMRASDALVHGPNYFLPHWAENGIITVHDLSVLLYPETHPVERVRDFEHRFQRSLDRASAIITDSKTVRREVIETLGVPPDKVFAVPLGISRMPDDETAQDTDLANFGITADCYTLCVSTFEPRKQIDCLIDAYEALPPSLRRAYPLVLVGANGWRNDKLNAQIASAERAGWLKRLNFLSDQALSLLYRKARLFVYPSRYEGFGLPPLEAMAQGVPTIISNADTLVEVAQGASRIADVKDRNAFALAMANALQDENWRIQAARAGLKVAEGYTWANCCAETIAVYRQVAMR